MLVEQVRERFQNPRTAGNTGGPGGALPFVGSVTIAGPHNARGPGRTPSRERIFVCRPTSPSDEPGCARTILSTLIRRAYRQPVSAVDLDVLVEFYEMGRADGGSFEDGIELALRRLLVSPEFLVRIEADPAGAAPDTPYAGHVPARQPARRIVGSREHPDAHLARDPYLAGAALTSHGRTSPVLRGKWILNNILGTPPPDPPPNVPALVDKKTHAKVATMRERMAAHRSNPVCAACHAMIDPAGFALEQFDAIGWSRVVDESFNQLDTSGVLPDGTAFDGVIELRAALVRKPERFANTVTEKLLTYALGRGLDYYDMPAVRRIVREAAPDDYGMQSIIVGIVNSYPFLHRRTES